MCKPAMTGHPAFGQVPGAGGAQHLVWLMGRARALEVMLSAQDYEAVVAEQYGWINRALPANALNNFVKTLAHRIARFPAAGLAAVKDRANAIALAPIEDFRRDSDLFGEGARKPEAQSRLQAAFKRGFQTRAAELDLASLLDDLPGPDRRWHSSPSCEMHFQTALSCARPIGLPSPGSSGTPRCPLSRKR
jgi:hypothetical protein